VQASCRRVLLTIGDENEEFSIELKTPGERLRRTRIAFRQPESECLIVLDLQQLKSKNGDWIGSEGMVGLDGYMLRISKMNNPMT
jgi:hypothetical protein